MADDLLTDTEGSWVPVSERLTTGRRLVLCLWAVPAVLAVLGLGAFMAWAFSGTVGAGVAAGGALVVLAGWAWLWRWVPRNRASWGYLEAEEELLVRGGLLFRRVVVVPYGRMQFVDVQSGPIATRYGYATVSLHTASSATAADIPGVPIAEATRLRNRLTELGESDDAGL